MRETSTVRGSSVRYSVAALFGMLLATLPFWRYAPIGGGLTAHTNHEPRHGGQLGMVGDHHVEIVRRRGQVEVFVSDAHRAPVKPLRGRIVFDGGREERLIWGDHRLTAADRPATTIETRITLADGTELAISFDFASEGSGGDS